MRKSYQFDIDKYRLTNTFPISVLPGYSGPSISKFFSDFRNKISVLAKFNKKYFINERLQSKHSCNSNCL